MFRDLTIKIQKYYISSFKDQGRLKWIEEPDARPISLFGYEDIDMFVIKHTIPKGTFWVISEAYTGYRLYMSCEDESRADAMHNVQVDMNLKKIKKQDLINLIENNIERDLLSPRYK